LVSRGRLCPGPAGPEPLDRGDGDAGAGLGASEVPRGSPVAATPGPVVAATPGPGVAATPGPGGTGAGETTLDVGAAVVIGAGAVAEPLLEQPASDTTAATATVAPVMDVRVNAESATKNPHLDKYKLPQVTGVRRGALSPAAAAGSLGDRAIHSQRRQTRRRAAVQLAKLRARLPGSRYRARAA